MSATATAHRITVGCDTTEEANFISEAIRVAQERYRTEQMDALHAEANAENRRRDLIGKSHRTVLKKAFAAIRREGIAVNVSIVSCCASCAELPESAQGKPHIWTLQKRWADCFYGDRLTDTLYLNWGHNDDDASEEEVLAVAQKAIEVMERFGLTTDWDGTTYRAIGIAPASVNVEAFDAATGK